MTVLFFAVVIALVALTQRTDARFFAGLAYAIVNLGHYLLAGWMSDWMYYVSAAAANILIMWWLLQLTHITYTVISLLRVSLVEACTNTMGLILWGNGFAPDVYNWVFVGLYTWVILILLRKDRADDRGGYRVGGWIDYLHLVVGTWRPALQRRGT